MRIRENQYKQAYALYISRQKLKTRKELLEKYNTSNILEASKPENYQELLDLILKWSEKFNIVSIFEDNYPKSLRMISDPPPILFSLGDYSILDNSNCCAIVGSRNADYLGLNIARKIAKSLANSNVKIISGLALGVDTMAHRGAVDSFLNQTTVAVLGSGLNNIYPSRNNSLAKQILEKNGLLLSQFEPDEKPLPYNFLNRNRLIAGLSKNVIIIQAGAKSGSLVTARYGLEQEKDIWVIPGDITNSRYKGSNLLIQQGANMLLGVEDLNFIYPELENKKEEVKISLSSDQRKIYNVLKQEGQQSFIRLSKKIDIQILNRVLMELELEGLIVSLPGNLYCVK